MVFAPSGDQTDDPSQTDLFLADSGPQILEGIERVPLKYRPNRGIFTPGTGRAPWRNDPVTHYIDPYHRYLQCGLGSIRPPDTSGVDYWPLTGRLLVSDSEVDEMPSYFTGRNVTSPNIGNTRLYLQHDGSRAKRILKRAYRCGDQPQQQPHLLFG